MKNIFILLISCIQSCVIVYAQPGTLDSTFDNDGKVTTKGKLAGVHCLVIQSTGKIIVGGSSGIYPVYSSALLRYKPDGSVDKNFGDKGLVTTLVRNSSIISDMKITKDGNIIAGGYSSDGSQNDFALTRYTAKGIVDSSFGKNGIVITDAGHQYEGISQIALLDDGKIIAVGGSNGVYIILFRYFPNGKVDSSFGVNGKVETTFQHALYPKSLAIQTDGKIVITGEYDPGGKEQDFVIVRYTAKGNLDSKFGTNGIVITDFGRDELSESLAIQADGKIVVGGSRGNNKNEDFLLARYKSNGDLDKSFGIKGKVLTSIGYVDIIFSVIIKPDGNILASGVADTSTNPFEFAIVQYKPTGELDSSFGTNGITVTDFSLTTNNYVEAAALQSDGKLVVLGDTYNSDRFIEMARYKVDNTLQANDHSIYAASMPKKLDNNYLAYVAQNIPNPFNRTTRINYTLPQKHSSAKIIVTDKNGKALMQINLSDKTGSVNVDASILSSGVYSYSLIVDGKLIGTKEMILAK